jgi:hypothetical protein
MVATSSDTSLLDQALDLVNRLSLEDQDTLMLHLLDKLAEANPAPEPHAPQDDEWALRGPQLEFMQQRHQAILDAIERDDDALLLGLADTPEFKALFGSMGWDEAFDRYEETWIDPT